MHHDKHKTGVNEQLEKYQKRNSKTEIEEKLQKYKWNYIPGGSTLNTRSCRKSCLIGLARSSLDADQGNAGKHAKT